MESGLLREGSKAGGKSEVVWVCSWPAGCRGRGVASPSAARLSGLKGQGGAPGTQVSIPKGRQQEQRGHSYRRVKKRQTGRKLCTGRPVCAPEAAQWPVIPAGAVDTCVALNQ